MRCNLQVVEALATVVKKEEEDESNKKGRFASAFRIHHQLRGIHTVATRLRADLNSSSAVERLHSKTSK